MKPVLNKDSYFLFVSSACDAGQPILARNILYEMVREEKADPSVSLISDNVLTMIMSAFLRGGNRVQAKKMYHEMIKRGIQPTSDVSWEIIRLYQKEGNPESLRIAIKLFKRLPKEDRKWDKDDS